MVKVKDGKHYMVASKRAVFRNFVIKAKKLYDFDIFVNWLTRVITFKNEKEARRCNDKLFDSRGIVAIYIRKNKMRVVTEKLVELVD